MELKKEKSVIALGNFDGLHIGHQRVIITAVQRAKDLGAKPKVLIFSEHPSKALGQGSTPMLMTLKAKKEKIKSLGAEPLVIDFSEIMELSCESFVKDILIEKAGAAALCCGNNYHFGKRAAGSSDTLRELCERYSLGFYLCDMVYESHAEISSSRIRKCIQSGNIVQANKMLGEPFSYNFTVVTGDKIGRTINSPTINQLFPENFILPLGGVYASKTEINGMEHDSLTNIGTRPTVNGTQMRSETYIIGYNGNLYGEKIKVSLIRYLRSERKFASLDELKAQISFDVNQILSQKDGSLSMEKLDVKGVFFDFDDTLQSRKGAYRLYAQGFLDRYFPNATAQEREIKLDQMEEYVDGGYKDREEYFPQLIELWKWKEHPPMQELYDSFNNDYGKYVVMLPYAVDVLEEIKRRGYIMGIISNGVSVLQNTKLDTAGIRDMFDVVVVSGDFGVYKPGREIFDEACRQAGLSNSECLFVGDHPVNDIQGALGAGMQVVRVNQGDFYNKSIDNRLITIEDLRDLLKVL